VARKDALGRAAPRRAAVCVRSSPLGRQGRIPPTHDRSRLWRPYQRAYRNRARSVVRLGPGFAVAHAVRSLDRLRGASIRIVRGTRFDHFVSMSSSAPRVQPPSGPRCMLTAQLCARGIRFAFQATAGSGERFALVLRIPLAPRSAKQTMTESTLDPPLTYFEPGTTAAISRRSSSRCCSPRSCGIASAASSTRIGACGPEPWRGPRVHSP
jgi:hypothetical protein